MVGAWRLTGPATAAACDYFGVTQPLLQAIDALQQLFQNLCFRPAFLGHRVYPSQLARFALPEFKKGMVVP